jgi:hypothetical protein
MSSNKVTTGGGYNNYSLRSATLVEGYTPGPSRQNFILDPDLAFGKFTAKPIGLDQWISGPGTLTQAIPDASKYQYERIFAVPWGNPYRNFGVDDRQIASYQVEQLHNNPLSQYTTNPNGIIPGFDCLEEPDNFSNMTNKRESEFKKFFENDDYLIDPKTTEVVDWSKGEASLGGLSGIDVYEQFHGNNGKRVNANAEVVYNLSLNSKEEVNPMISQGSSSVARSRADFSGRCYSGNYIPGEIISNTGGNNPPTIYGGSYVQPRTEMDTGFMNPNVGKSICVPDRSLSFANPLIINHNIY